MMNVRTYELDSFEFTEQVLILLESDCYDQDCFKCEEVSK